MRFRRLFCILSTFLLVGTVEAPAWAGGGGWGLGLFAATLGLYAATGGPYGWYSPYYPDPYYYPTYRYPPPYTYANVPYNTGSAPASYDMPVASEPPRPMLCRPMIVPTSRI